MIQAVKLREKHELLKINDSPGYYKWWACDREFNLILNTLKINLTDIRNAIEIKNGMVCIYVGIAEKESVRKRLDWHVNDKHTESRVYKGILSTLRQSISSIVAHNQFDKIATNNFIDNLFVEWFYIENPITSNKTHTELHQIEYQLLTEYFRILNIRDNHHPYAIYTTKKLRLLRKASKNKQP